MLDWQHCVDLTITLFRFCIFGPPWPRRLQTISMQVPL